AWDGPDASSAWASATSSHGCGSDSDGSALPISRVSGPASTPPSSPSRSGSDKTAAGNSYPTGFPESADTNAPPYPSDTAKTGGSSRAAGSCADSGDGGRLHAKEAGPADSSAASRSKLHVAAQKAVTSASVTCRTRT